MSLFKSIKGTFQSVQQDLSVGIRSLTDPSKSRVPPTVVTGSAVNYDVGAGLLQKHQLIWQDLYQTTADTAKTAEEVDAVVGDLFVYYDRQCEILARLHSEAASLPVLLSQLQDVTDSLAQVEEEYDKVESALVRLEDACEEQQLQSHMISHQKQLDAYRAKKAHELDKMKAQLARDHAVKVQQKNRQRQSLLKERQSAFGEQFSQDVDYYKKHGKPGRLPSTPESEKKLDIAEIEVTEDQDAKALDEFLATSESDAGIALSESATGMADIHEPSSHEDVETESKDHVTSPVPPTQAGHQPDQYSAGQESKTEPITSQESKTEPIISRESKTVPITSRESKTEPITSQESKTEPITIQEFKTEPIISQEFKTEPIISQESKTEPITSRESKTEPITSQEFKTEPIISQESKTEPIASQESKTEPMISRESKMEPITSQESKTEPDTETG